MHTKFLLAASLLMLFSCTRNLDSKETTTADTPAFEGKDLQQVEQDTAGSGGTLKPVNMRTTSDWDKKIIKTAEVSMEVKDFNSFGGVVQRAIRQHGGYIASENNELSDHRKENTVSIKVPVAAFDDLLTALSNAEGKVISKNISTEDVTAQLIDTRARLLAKKEMRTKYLEFMRSSKNMAEVLQVQAEINGIQEEIEAAASRINYMGHSAAYSTINLRYYQLMNLSEPVNETPSFVARIRSAFETGGSLFKDMLVGLMYIWPLLLVIAAGFYFTKRKKSSKPVIPVR